MATAGWMRPAPPRPAGRFTQVKPRPSAFRQVAAPSPRAGFQQVRPQPARAGFTQQTDKNNPAARSYALHRLHGLVAQGVIPKFSPSWNKDPAAVWRAMSGMLAESGHFQSPNMERPPQDPRAQLVDAVASAVPAQQYDPMQDMWGQTGEGQGQMPVGNMAPPPRPAPRRFASY